LIFLIAKLYRKQEKLKNLLSITVIGLMMALMKKQTVIWDH